MQRLTPGTKLTDVLTLVRILGEGGMGTVWLANHRMLGTEVAVKVMHPELGYRDPSLLERFAAEARAAAKIRHPHIVQMLDHGKTEDGTAWLSMELLEGESLGALLRREGAVPIPFAVTVIEQVASAVAKAHAAGIIHRDLKPENLQVLTVAGKPFVKVLDFGIAKATTQSSGMTATSAVFGTPAYMSPEQLLSTKKVDAGTDLWALSVIAYELLTGQLPFEGETSSAIAVAVAMGRFSPPSSLKRDLGTALDAWFFRAFERKATARFQSAEELGATFAQAVGAQAAGAHAASAHAASAQAAPSHPKPQGSGQLAASAALPKTKVVAPAFLAERGGAEVASSPRIPEAPAATFVQREEDSSVTLRIGLAVAGVALLGVLGVVYLSGEKDPSADARLADAKAEVDRKTANTDPNCKPGSGMKLIPAGTFTMGDDSDTSKAAQVTVAGFCMGTSEVTTSGYATCVQTGKCTAANTSGSCNAGVAGRGNHPINCVDWKQATAYCEAQGQRLPTKEEWEYAARGTDGRIYPWGNAEPAGQLCWNGEGNSLGKRNRHSTCAVASIPAGNSPFGLADMAGNVWEWTSTAYSATNADRVLRGGGWDNDNPSVVRSAIRPRLSPSNSADNLGFRCAASASVLGVGLAAPTASATPSAVVLPAPAALATPSAVTRTDKGKQAEVKAPTGDASVGGASVGGGAVANASSVVARMKGRFRSCYQAGLNSNPEMSGNVTLVATIGPNGEVLSVGGGGGGGFGAIVGCLKSVVQGASFSPPEGGKASVSIPITFVKQ